LHVTGVLPEVRASYITDEKRISGENGMRVPLFVLEEITVVVGGMAGCEKSLEAYLADPDILVKVKPLVGIVHFHFRVNVDRSPMFIVELQMATHEIRMGMGFENGGNVGVVVVGEFLIGLRIPSGIDHGHFAIAHHRVGGVGQTIIEELFYGHSSLFSGEHPKGGKGSFAPRSLRSGTINRRGSGR
jgi:hypothetical protein